MTHGRHTKVRPHYWVGAATAAVVLLAVVLVNWSSSDDAPRAQPRDVVRDRASGVAVTGSAGSTADRQDPVAAALDSCRGMHAQQSTVLLSADRSLGQWRTHVEAMNQLVAGEITLDQAYQFWEQTRVGAAERIEQFTAADGVYLGSGASCPAVADARDGDVPELRGCRRDTAARDEVLDSARVALTTWSHHVHDMELLRAGTLSPERATELWLRYWRQGVDELEDYWAKARTAGQTTC